MDTSGLSLGFAFFAGLASFLSPCVFSLVPAYIGYLGGQSVSSAESGESNRWITFTHGVAFVLGFSIVFILLGLGASALGSLLFDIRPLLTKIGGVVVVIFGLHMIGIIRIPFLQYDTRRQVMPDRKLGYLSSGLMGVFFSAGWSPCVGPVLGTILTLSLSGGSVTQGGTLLAAYSAGLAIPFLFAATQISLVTKVIRRYGKVMRYAEIVIGVIMVIVGVMLFVGRFEQLASLGLFFDNIDEVALGRYLLVGLVALIVLGLLPAYIAHRKGRSFYDWWFFGAALFPIALPAAVLIEAKDEAGEEKTPGEDLSLSEQQASHSG